MEERRRLQRHRVFKRGSIAFNRAGAIDCQVRNVSPIGACLEVASQVGIPDEFLLLIDHDHFRRPCHVIWRKPTRMGVQFDAEKQAA
ncbi:MAG TPA: PilZ domain-containing protein [Pseudolabrys sp.]|nr:PilZ domain-containing protein [Pseudolabrys sp.]